MPKNLFNSGEKNLNKQIIIDNFYFQIVNPIFGIRCNSISNLIYFKKPLLSIQILDSIIQQQLHYAHNKL